MAWLDGELNWNSGWPTGSTNLDTSSDVTYSRDLGGNKTYMPAISPCFFTYYAPNSYNKDFIYRSDDWLLATRMEMIVAMRNKVEFAEIISWNGECKLNKTYSVHTQLRFAQDYGESHYIGPIRADQPDSQSWTNGMPHSMSPSLPL